MKNTGEQVKNTGIRITQDQKEEYLKKNKKKAQKAFEGFGKDRENFIKIIRKKFGYSPRTIDGDILASFKRVWKQRF